MLNYMTAAALDLKTVSPHNYTFSAGMLVTPGGTVSVQVQNILSSPLLSPSPTHSIPLTLPIFYSIPFSYVIHLVYLSISKNVRSSLQ
jgi:hypothetical protein